MDRHTHRERQNRCNFLSLIQSWIDLSPPPRAYLQCTTYCTRITAKIVDCMFLQQLHVPLEQGETSQLKKKKNAHTEDVYLQRKKITREQDGLDTRTQGMAPEAVINQ